MAPIDMAADPLMLRGYGGGRVDLIELGTVVLTCAAQARCPPSLMRDDGVVVEIVPPGEWPKLWVRSAPVAQVDVTRFVVCTRAGYLLRAVNELEILVT